MFVRGISANNKCKYTIMIQGKPFLLRRSILIPSGLYVFTGA